MFIDTNNVDNNVELILKVIVVYVSVVSITTFLSSSWLRATLPGESVVNQDK